MESKSSVPLRELYTIQSGGKQVQRRFRCAMLVTDHIFVIAMS